MTGPTFRCGHPKTPENSAKRSRTEVRCRECDNARRRKQPEWEPVPPTFRCGCPKTPENTRHFVDVFDRPRTRCRACHNRAARKSEREARAKQTKTEKQRIGRMQRMPQMLANTRRKLAQLEREAREYGMAYLLEETGK